MHGTRSALFFCALIAVGPSLVRGEILYDWPEPAAPPPESVASAARLWTEFGLGMQAELSGDCLEALRHYPDPDSFPEMHAEMLTRRAACELELGRDPDALRHARAAIALDSLRVEAFWVAGLAQVHLGEIEDAVRDLDRAARLRVEVRTLNLLATLLEQLDRDTEALAVIEQLTVLMPNSIGYLERRAALRVRVGQTESAIEDYRTILALDPANSGAIAALRKLLGQLNRTDELLQFQRSLLSASPERSDLHWELIRLLMQERRWDEAAREVEVLRSRTPDDPAPVVQLALIAYRQGRTEQTFDLLKEAGRLAPDAGPVLRWRMRLYLAEEHCDSALASAIRLTTLRDDDVEAWKVRGICLAQDAKDVEGALAALRRWADLDPEDPEPLRLMAEILRSQGRREDGLVALSEALKRAPGDSALRVDHATLLEEAGRTDEAEEALRSVLAQEPGNAVALNALGYLLADHGRRLDEAESLIRGALQEDPDRPAFLDSIGWLCYKKGDLKEAERWLQRAIEKGGRHPEIYGHLARVQIERGKRRQAEETLRKGLAWSPQDSILLRLLQDL